MFSLVLAIEKRSSLYRTLPIPPLYHLPFVGFYRLQRMVSSLLPLLVDNGLAIAPKDTNFPTPLQRSTHCRLKASHFSSLLRCQFYVFSSTKTNDTQFKFGGHTLYCTNIVLKFPMDAPFVVKAHYYSTFLAPLALLVAPILVQYLPGYVTRDNSKSTRTRKTPFPVPDLPLVPFVPILVIVRGKKR